MARVQDFNMKVDRVAHVKGDRVVITLSEWPRFMT